MTDRSTMLRQGHEYCVKTETEALCKSRNSSTEKRAKRET